jgi:NAD(P)-dependent dehydrogenase (short-subunit alcohol dehydrogenase family)
MSAKHAGKIVVITGGASGIGQAIVRRLAQEGVRVAIADVAGCAETVELARQAGGDASGFQVESATGNRCVVSPIRCAPVMARR